MKAMAIGVQIPTLAVQESREFVIFWAFDEDSIPAAFEAIQPGEVFFM